MRVAPVTPLTSYVGRRIMFQMLGTLRFRSITAAIADGLDHRLTMSSNLGEPVPVGTRVHFLTAVRADADRIEITHSAVASEVTIAVVDAPE